MYDLIIIGGGPAGITAGIYASRQKLNTLLITKTFGGQVARKAVKIENYPGFLEVSGQELIEKLINHLKKYSICIELDEVIRVEKREEGFGVYTKSQKTFEAKAIIVASGADPRPLEAEREKEFIGRGVSYCVTCDGPLFKGKTVAVIGGGNAGFEAAIFLSDFAKKIYQDVQNGKYFPKKVNFSAKINFYEMKLMILSWKIKNKIEVIKTRLWRI